MDSRTSGPLRRNFSNGFSGKPIVGAQKLLSRVEDYTDIFGGVGSSSIPVLDLSADNDTSEAVNFRSSDLDYSNIFGGFRDEGIGVSYEELVCNAELRGERNFSGNIGTGSATGSPSKSSDHSSLSKENQVFSSEAPYLSFNDKKHFNMSYHKTSIGSKYESNEKIHVARFHPEPGFTFFVDDSTPQKSKADQPDSSITSDIRRKLDFSDGLLESHHNKKAMPHPDTKKPNRRQVDPATGFNQDGSYSNVKLHNAHVINLKPIPSNERLSPNGAAHKENSNGITKRSTASNSEAPKGIASEQAIGDGSLPLFDQELDVNSAAAVSAAALKDAIQKAQKSIRMAKELMERKKAGLRNRPNQDIKPSSFPYLDKETLMKQVIVEKEEEDEKAHDMGFIKGKVHAVIKEMDKENVDKLVCNMHQHVEMETPPISQEDEDCEKTLVESQQNVEENKKFEYHELRCADYEEMMHKTQEPDQNKQHANCQQEHLEKRAEKTKEEPEYTPRNTCDVEVERFEDAIEWVENENQPRNRGSEGDGKEKKGIHMAEDVESDRGHMTIDEKRSTLHDGEESGENFWRFELKGSENYVRSYGDEKPENIETESEEIQVLPQAHYRRSMSRESGPWSSDASENNAEYQGACRPDMIDDNYSKTNQQVDDKSRSIDKATTDFYDFKVREAEEAKIACTEFSETASLVHGAAEGRNNMKTDFVVLPSENSIPKFGLTEMDLENTEAEQRERDFGPNINSDNGAQILVNRSLGKGYIFEENETYCDEEAEKITHEIANGEGQHVVIMKNFGIYSGPSVSRKIEKVIEVDKEIRERQNTQINENSCNTTAEEDKEMKKINTENDIDGKEGHPKEIFAKKETETQEAESQGAVENEYLRKNYEENKRERQREKDRIAVERAIQEARDRAFAEARERAAMDRAAAEVRQRVMAETRGKLEKSTTTSKSSVDRASIEAKIRSERAAVERATAEARERALEKALSQNTASRAQADKSATGNMSDSFRDTAAKISDGTTTESAQRSKARSERQERIMERAAKALAEKNMRDLLVQKEEAEKNRLAESLHTEIKRWSSGKEGNLRALLSTLQYILGPGSGWQPISLTDIITTNAVKKAYRKATLYVHPDKLQQRGASIREKYICEKVFDLLKVAWNRFNSEER